MLAQRIKDRLIEWRDSWHGTFFERSQSTVTTSIAGGNWRTIAERHHESNFTSGVGPRITRDTIETMRTLLLALLVFVAGCDGSSSSKEVVLYTSVDEPVARPI